MGNSPEEELGALASALVFEQQEQQERMRALLQGGTVPSHKMMRPEVAECIIKYKNPFVE